MVRKEVGPDDLERKSEQLKRQYQNWAQMMADPDNRWWHLTVQADKWETNSKGPDKLSTFINGLAASEHTVKIPADKRDEEQVVGMIAGMGRPEPPQPAALKGPIPLAMAHFFNSSFVVPGTSLLSLFPRPRKRHWSFKTPQASPGMDMV